jgi:hypothetical protein
MFLLQPRRLHITVVAPADSDRVAVIPTVTVEGVVVVSVVIAPWSRNVQVAIPVDLCAAGVSFGGSSGGGFGAEQVHVQELPVEDEKEKRGAELVSV